jgi:hypothetical protein
MKTAVFVFCLCLFCASAGFGQAGVLGGEAQQLQMADHGRHAEQHDMAHPQNILEHSEFAYEKGERPLWEFGPITQPVPLGDVARAYRKEHALAKKADILWEN